MSDLKCQECGHDADAHITDPDGVGDCIIGWTKRSPRNKCDCTNTSEQAELSALRAENAQLKSQLSAPLDRLNDPEEIEIGEVIDYNRRLLGEIAQMQRGIERARLMAWVLYEKTGGEDLSDIHNALAMLKRDDFSAPLDRLNEEGK